MVKSIFVQCTKCGQTIDRLSHLTPGFYHKITCPTCHEVTIVDVDKDGVITMHPAEEGSTPTEPAVKNNH
ncbi:MAG: hypothetical protein QNJ45_17145 [Ardenticatenaceae bacterium]|nr:hypothetical protein [Ardenticatenaceae bacterium]